VRVADSLAVLPNNPDSCTLGKTVTRPPSGIGQPRDGVDGAQASQWKGEKGSVSIFLLCFSWRVRNEEPADTLKAETLPAGDYNNKT
jgi:hypothetical protein